MRGATSFTQYATGSASFQSTHPLRGATNGHDYVRRRRKFQSTHPLRGATVSTWNCRKSVKFQSTHPLRGATSDISVSLEAIDISIHAPLAGCDVQGNYLITDSIAFQSTHPLRGATTCILDLAVDGVISIHAPLAGCDVRYHGDRHSRRISIHAPLAGCDRLDALNTMSNTHFNPRTPCGVRLKIIARRNRKIEFQSTHPLRGATLYLVPIRGSHRQQRADSLKNKYYQFKTNNYAF